MGFPRLRATDVIAESNGVVSFYFQRWLDRLCRAVDTNVRTITVSDDVRPDDYLILANAAAGAVTVRLPIASDNLGRALVIKKIDASANVLTIDGFGSELIDNGATIALTTQYSSSRLLSDGAAWWGL